jgi:hypothetical protein
MTRHFVESKTNVTLRNIPDVAIETQNRHHMCNLSDTGTTSDAPPIKLKPCPSRRAIERGVFRRRIVYSNVKKQQGTVNSDLAARSRPSFAGSQGLPYKEGAGSTGCKPHPQPRV